MKLRKVNGKIEIIREVSKPVKEEIEIKNKQNEERLKKQKEYIENCIGINPNCDKYFIKEVFSRIDIGEENDCHIWKGSIIPDTGYGRIKYKGKTIRAHRALLMIHNIKIPEGLIVMHTCNNKLCVNKNHLRIGTNAENSEYMVKCKRQISGNQILDKEHVNKIRELNNTGKYSYEVLAEMFRVSKSTIAHIISNISFKDDNYKRTHEGTRLGRRNKHHIYSNDVENEIKEKYSKNKISQEQLAKDYGLSKGTIYNIVHNKTWRNKNNL